MSSNPSSHTDRVGRLAGLLAAALLGLAATVDAAEPTPPAAVAPPPSASIILNLMSKTPESASAAMAESLRPDGAPTPARVVDSQTDVLADGTIRHRQGNTTLYLKNPCPEGDPFHDKLPLARPLPGRTRR